MPKAEANGIEIEYDVIGTPSDPPLLLIAGLGRQLMFWDEEFCQNLAGRGFYVIRYDNRDTGLSTKFEAGGVPDIAAVYNTTLAGGTPEVPYTLDDMADDAAGLLEALRVRQAHICGASMGAAITQTMGYRHPGRVRSLIPIMGTTGNPALPQAQQEVMDFLLTPAPEERQAYIEYTVRMWKVFWGTLPFDEDDVRGKAAAEYDRSFYPQGVARQLAAIIAHGNRRSRLASVSAPTLVIHGAVDPLIPPEGGRDTAEAIAGAQLRIVEGMGHSLPRAAWPEIVDAISGHATAAQRQHHE